jgi:hypothetical protein
MRAFTIMLGVAMLGAVSLATTGAIWTVSQTRHTAIAFGLGGGSALARNASEHRPALAVVAMPITPVETAHDGAAATGDEGPDLFRTADR